MTQLKYNKADVQKSIFQQTINSQTISYSYASKSQATLSLLKNQRLLIFNSTTGQLYYINEPKSLPFITQIPKPKNDSADMNISMAKNPPGTDQFTVQFGTKNDKGETTSIQWTFIMDNKNLATSWLNLIKQFKDKKIQQILQEKQKLSKTQDKKQKPQQQPNQNSRIITNNAFIHDTIGYGIMQPQKYHSRTPLSQQTQPPKYNDSPNKITQSKHQLSPQNPLLNSTTKPSNNNLLLIPGVLQTSHQNSPQRRSFLKENQDSRLTFKDEIQDIISRSRTNQQNNTQKPYRPENDWNLKFLQTQSEQVMLDFQEYATKQFYSTLNDDRKSRQNIRVYLRPDCMIIITNARTVEAKKIKSEFRNYHFITESCKDRFIVGVPLACLIQFEGVVALIKSLIPDHAPRLEFTEELMLDMKDLERYTRVKNGVLKKATLYDLSKIYGSTGKRLIYINQLIEYLPLHIDQSFIGGSLRAQHMLDNVEQFMAGGMAIDGNRYDLKILNDTLEMIKKNVSQVARELSCNDLVFANGVELKDMLHSRGINLKHLPQLYQETTNKQVKRYIHTFMVAKIAKDNILENLAETRSIGDSGGVKEVIQKSIRLLVEGNSNMSNELWKEIAVNFRKEYGIPMSNNDILGPFFLNCLMKIISGNYDSKKINMSKVMFKEDGIIGKGFIVELVAKVKTYYRYTTQKTQKIMMTCKGERLYENYLAIVDELGLKTNSIPRYLTLSKTDLALKEYLSFYTCPNEFEPSSFAHLNLFEPILTEPPSSTSLMITYNYLIWCLQKQEYSRFNEVLAKTLKLIDLWLDPNHVLHCEFYQALSQYYQQIGSIEDSVNLMKESLGVCIRSGGVGGRRTGEKYMSLGEMLMRVGRVQESVENLLKAKGNMETHKVSTIRYPMVLTKLAQGYLAGSDFMLSLQYGKQAVEKFEELESRRGSTVTKGFYDEYSIKAMEVMSRVFEIQEKKTEMFRLGQMASVKYNKSANPRVFETMVKMCLSGLVMKHSVEKGKVLEGIVEKVILGGQGEEVLSKEDSLQEMMRLGQQYNVMERWMMRFDSLERVAGEINSRRALSVENKEFVAVLRLIVGLVGEDYVLGLVQEKQVEQ